MDAEEVEEARHYWNDFAENFAKFEEIMEQSWTVMIKNLRLESARSVIEIGAGRGKCSNAIVSRLPSTCRLVVTDLADEMVKISSQVLKSYKNVKVQQANALNLEEFEAGSFDRYIANMVLHLVPNPEEMLRQARRVLKDGGLASFSVWGNKANSSMFSLRPFGDSNTFFNFGEDVNKIRSLFQKTGFRKVIFLRVPCVLELWDGRNAAEFWKTVEGRNLELENDLQWYNKMVEKFEDQIQRGSPIGLESLIIFAQ
jgi:SAM-dependent methyltransferase